jgi:hypothetical protein
VFVLLKACHQGAVTCYVAVADEPSTHGAAESGVVCEEADVMDSPHYFLSVCELNVVEDGVFGVE